MTEHKHPEQVSSEPEVEPELIKDLDVDETQTDQVRGGNSAVAGPGRVSGASK